jgi:hypothetical protein
VAYRWELDGPARLDAASLPEQVRQELDRFMEAVTIVDPADCGRAPGDPDRPVRTLAFDPHGEGLVTSFDLAMVATASAVVILMNRLVTTPRGARRLASSLLYPVASSSVTRQRS